MKKTIFVLIALIVTVATAGLIWTVTDDSNTLKKYSKI